MLLIPRANGLASRGVRFDSYVLNTGVMLPNVSTFRRISRSEKPPRSRFGPACVT